MVQDITSPPAQWSALGDGFKADVRIVGQTVPDAPKVPVSALCPTGGRARQHEVEVLAH